MRITSARSVTLLGLKRATAAFVKFVNASVVANEATKLTIVNAAFFQ